VKVEIRKIPPTHLHLLCNSSQLPSEFRRGVFLDLFDALNLVAVFVFPSLSPLVVVLQAKMLPKFLKNSTSFFTPPLSPLSTTIRTAWSVGFRLIRCAESACNIHLSIAPVVLEPQAKAFQIPQVKIPPKVFPPPCTASPTYNQNSVEG
jgi:hypothetical protein